MPIDFKHARLSNGMNVIAEIDPSAHTAAVGFFVKTGARDEPRELMGVSHFLEHMIFKGTAKRTAEMVDRDFDAIGAVHNAFTTAELTAFYAHMLPEHMGEAEEILADILRPALRAEDFESEKNVILEEIAMYDDQPFWVLYERVMEEFYQSHPLGHRVLGTNETISQMSVEAMRSYFHSRYTADNTAVSAAGRLDFPKLLDELELRCSTWQCAQPKREYPAVSLVDEVVDIESERITMHYLLMLAPGPPAHDDRRYAMAVLMHILGGSDSSRLHWALTEPGLAEEASAHYEGRDGTGELFISAVCLPENSRKVEDVARREIESLIGSLTDDDLLRVRSRIATGAALSGERPAGRMRRLGSLWTMFGAYRSLEEELAKIDAVTIDALREVSALYPFEPKVVGRLRPKGE
jgi:predicted Zn-dependent peptidase